MSTTSTTKRKPYGAGRDPMVGFRAPVEFVAAVREAAERKSLTFSEYVRALLQEKLDELAERAEEARR